MSTTLTTRMDHDQNVPRPTSLARITTVPLVVASPDQQDIEMSEVPTLFDADDNLQTFALFLLLEDEVRYKIWALNLPGPRLVEVVEQDGEFYCSAFRVINLQVCRESRREAQKTHPISFSVNYRAPQIPFCFEKDGLLLAGNIENPEVFKRMCNPRELAKVQHLVVDRNICWHVREVDDRGYGLGKMSRLIFSGVKDYTCIFTGGVDVLPTWAYDSWFPWLSRSPQERRARYQTMEAVQWLKNFWPLQEYHRIQISEDDCELNRYGGIPYETKYEPAIKRWDIPRVFTMGVDGKVIKGFRGSDVSSWEQVIMDRAIEDIFD